MRKIIDSKNLCQKNDRYKSDKDYIEFFLHEMSGQEFFLSLSHAVGEDVLFVCVLERGFGVKEEKPSKNPKY